MDRYGEIAILYTEAAALYTNGDAASQAALTATTDKIAPLFALLEVRLVVFFRQYLALLILWTLASMTLVGVNTSLI